jgi:hypothetical protein
MRDVETISHLVIHCPYAQHLWKYLEKQLEWTMFGEVLQWRNVRVWFQKKELKFLREIPCLTIWGIWMACNAQIFEGKQIPTFHIYNQVYGIFHGCKLTSKIRQPQQVGDLYIDKSSPFGFFDGARQGQDNFSSAREVFYSYLRALH